MSCSNSAGGTFVVEALRLDGVPGLGQAEEVVFIEALVAGPSVEALDVGILVQLAGLDEVQLNAPFWWGSLLAIPSSCSLPPPSVQSGVACSSPRPADRPVAELRVHEVKLVLAVPTGLAATVRVCRDCQVAPW